ncbi:putative F16A11.1 [Operophtera brumata]|uniref:Putative F16A11.1 n=1 Tax=Operophtera brumata TaxID=104452 RepID=A0A0L7LIB4_OPEBR|nr:putative F16A11.1 [Operophtera brumata]
MNDTNAMLDCRDTTDFLKISSDGLEARCDAHTFESVRCTFQINQGCWYYEVEILTPGVMQIGWATKETKFSTHEGYGIGDDCFSLAYDGCRRLLWHKATPKICDTVNPWAPGDIVGCLIDVGQQEAIFSLNGARLPVCKDIFKSSR